MLEYTRHLYRKSKLGILAKLSLAFVLCSTALAFCKALGIGTLLAAIIPLAALLIKSGRADKKKLCIMSAYAVLSAIALAVII